MRSPVKSKCSCGSPIRSIRCRQAHERPGDAALKSGTDKRVDLKGDSKSSGEAKQAQQNAQRGLHQVQRGLRCHGLNHEVPCEDASPERLINSGITTPDAAPCQKEAIHCSIHRFLHRARAEHACRQTCLSRPARVRNPVNSPFTSYEHLANGQDHGQADTAPSSRLQAQPKEAGARRDSSQSEQPRHLGQDRSSTSLRQTADTAVRPDSATCQCCCALLSDAGLVMDKPADCQCMHPRSFCLGPTAGAGRTTLLSRSWSMPSPSSKARSARRPPKSARQQRQPNAREEQREAEPEPARESRNHNANDDDDGADRWQSWSNTWWSQDNSDQWWQYPNEHHWHQYGAAWSSELQSHSEDGSAARWPSTRQTEATSAAGTAQETRREAGRNSSSATAAGDRSPPELTRGEEEPSNHTESANSARGSRESAPTGTAVLREAEQVMHGMALQITAAVNFPAPRRGAKGCYLSRYILT